MHGSSCNRRCLVIACFGKTEVLIGDGEKEAICLAIQQEHFLLILDDRLARRQAAKLGLTFIGLVRLLSRKAYWIARSR